MRAIVDSSFVNSILIHFEIASLIFPSLSFASPASTNYGPVTMPLHSSSTEGIHPLMKHRIDPLIIDPLIGIH